PRIDRHLVPLETDTRLLRALGQLARRAVGHHLVVERLTCTQERVATLLVRQLVAPLPHPRCAGRIIFLGAPTVHPFDSAVVVRLLGCGRPLPPPPFISGDDRSACRSAPAATTSLTYALVLLRDSNARRRTCPEQLLDEHDTEPNKRGSISA